jgi:hypothetical protein
MKRMTIKEQKKRKGKSFSHSILSDWLLIISRNGFFLQSISQIISRFSSKYNTDNMQIKEKKWHVGIDTSKETLDVAVFDIEKNRSNKNYLKIGNDTSGFKVMRQWFKCRGMKFANIVVCMEYTGIYGYNIRKFLERNAID